MPVPAPASVEALLSTMVGFNTVNSSVTGNMFAEVKLAEYLEKLATHFGVAARRLPVPGRVVRVLVAPGQQVIHGSAPITSVAQDPTCAGTRPR